MKHSVLIYLVIGVAFIFFGCSEDNLMTPDLVQNDQAISHLKGAVKPASKLVGTMELDFTFGDWPEEPVWVGTIQFEGYGTFGVRFYHLSPFKDYSQASPFEEIFEIYDLGDPDLVYLGGPDVGVTVLANKPPEPCTYRLNGEVEVANEPFEEWLGRHVHASGIITWQFLTLPDGTVIGPVPNTAPGILRIN